MPKNKKLTSDTKGVELFYGKIKTDKGKFVKLPCAAFVKPRRGQKPLRAVYIAGADFPNGENAFPAACVNNQKNANVYCAALYSFLEENPTAIIWSKEKIFEAAQYGFDTGYIWKEKDTKFHSGY